MTSLNELKKYLLKILEKYNESIDYKLIDGSCDCQSRAQNIIIFNLSEKNSSAGNSDVNKLNTILKELELNYTPTKCSDLVNILLVIDH